MFNNTDMAQHTFDFSTILGTEPNNQVKQTKRTDFRLRAGHMTDYMLPLSRAEANLAAIKTLKLIEHEKRPATREEQESLSKYVGWGGLAEAFIDHSESKLQSAWVGISKTLKSELTQTEYNQARKSTLDSFYTPLPVISAIYRALQHFGFQGGKVLEPSCGIGHFIGAMPPALKKNSDITGIELDEISGRIAQALYPKQDIRTQGFEEACLPKGSFDVVVGNVPFGDFKIHDPEYDGYKIHDYFMVKTLDMVRPGGVVALITSTGTLDKKNTKIRRTLQDQADLIGAIRLPENTFAGNAGTKTVTDILFLRKRIAGEHADALDWISTAPATIDGQESDLELNKYFATHPEMMIGKVEKTTSRFGEKITLKHSGDLNKPFNKAIRRLPAKFMGVSSIARVVDQNAARTIKGDAVPTELQEGAYFIHGGALYVKKEGRGVPVQHKFKSDVAKTRAYVSVRDCVKTLIDLQLKQASDEVLAPVMAKLDKVYSEFHNQFGPINLTKVIETANGRSQRRMPNLKSFRDDPDVYLVASIEDVHEHDDGTFTYARGPIFTQRVIRKTSCVSNADTATDALAISLDQSGSVDFDFMANLYGKTADLIKGELGSAIYENPQTHGWETAESYLSGNVRVKLVEAIDAAQNDNRFDRNVKALKSVIPADLKAEEILVSFGAPWVPTDIVAQFIQELLDHKPGDVRVSYSNFNAKWSVNFQGAAKPKARIEYGTSEMSAYELAEKALNFKTPKIMKQVYLEGSYQSVVDEEATIAATAKMREIERLFTGSETELGWIWKDQERTKRLCRLYNDTFNATVARKFDGSHQTFPGLAAVINDATGKPVPFVLREHQKNAVWRIVSGQNALLAHCVGAGKTFTMVVAGQEMKRLGIIDLPAYVVPNHMLEQFSREFNQAYPGAKLLVADKENFSKKKRKIFVARAATGQHDAVIITHAAFGHLAMSSDYQQRFLQGEVDILTQLIKDSERSNPSVKDMERSRCNLEAKIQGLLNAQSKDDGLTFEQLGIDYLFVDEAHLFKNLAFATKMERVKGLGQSESQRAMDLYMKIRWLDEQRPEKVVTFATATPISNTIAEMFTMQRYLQLSTLEGLGLGHFDAWAKSFGEVTEDVELAPSGKGFRVVRKFARFRNVPELITSFSEVADYQTREMLNLPAPKIVGGGAKVITAEASDWQKGFIDELADRAANLKGRPEAGQDNMLLICSEGRKAALDPRLLFPDLPDNPHSKVNKLIKNVLDIYHRPGVHNRAQLIFCDQGTPKKHGEFSVYEDIRLKLIDAGIPASEIAYAQSAKTDQAKARLHARVRNGQVRILLGSTETLGVGTNVQRLLCAIHHLDAPWRPSDVEQRDGRGVRQGNLNDEIEIFRYVTAGTFDAYSWQTLETKAQFIAQILAGAKGQRHCEDVDSPLPEAAAIKALATGDQRIIEAVMLEKELNELGHIRNAFNGLKRRATIRASHIPEEVQAIVTETKAIKADLNTRKKQPLVVGGQTYATKDEAARAVIAEIKKALGSIKAKDRKWHQYDMDGATFCGFGVTMSLGRDNFRSKSGLSVAISLKGEGIYRVPLGRQGETSLKGLNISFGRNIVVAMAQKVNSMVAMIQNNGKEVARLKAELVEVEKMKIRDWPQEAEYQEKLDQYHTLQAELQAEEENRNKKEAA